MIARLAIVLVQAYRLLVSPLISPYVRCRFQPTCSAYAIEALRVHGAWHGLWLALGRLLRCNPAGSHGPDPVPPRRQNPFG